MDSNELSKILHVIECRAISLEMNVKTEETELWITNGCCEDRRQNTLTKESFKNDGKTNTTFQNQKQTVEITDTKYGRIAERDGC